MTAYEDIAFASGLFFGMVALWCMFSFDFYKGLGVITIVFIGWIAGDIAKWYASVELSKKKGQ